MNKALSSAPKLSIVTVVLNDLEGLKRTIESIINWFDEIIEAYKMIKSLTSDEKVMIESLVNKANIIIQVSLRQMTIDSHVHRSRIAGRNDDNNGQARIVEIV